MRMTSHPPYDVPIPALFEQVPHLSFLELLTHLRLLPTHHQVFLRGRLQTLRNVSISSFVRFSYNYSFPHTIMLLFFFLFYICITHSQYDNFILWILEKSSFTSENLLAKSLDQLVAFLHAEIRSISHSYRVFHIPNWNEILSTARLLYSMRVCNL